MDKEKKEKRQKREREKKGKEKRGGKGGGRVKEGVRWDLNPGPTEYRALVRIGEQ